MQQKGNVVLEMLQGASQPFDLLFFQNVQLT